MPINVHDVGTLRSFYRDRERRVMQNRSCVPPGKGGFGFPMVISLVLFLGYHFAGTFSRNAAEDGSLDPALASWIPNLIMLPLWIYLISRASSDKTIINLENIISPFKKVFQKNI